METQSAYLKLATKIASVKKTIGKLSKSLENPFHKSSYFDINLLIEHVEPLLSDNGILLMQPIINGCVVSQLIDLESGEINESSIKLPELNDPQKVGSCITYYRRYALQSQLGIQAEDDDANKASTTQSGKANQQNNSGQRQKQWLNPGTPQWKDAIIYLKGEGTIDKIERKYQISKKNKEQLIQDTL